MRPMRHQITIDTKPKNNRRVDPPRSRWWCNCGAGSDDDVSPEEAHRAADLHLAARGKTGAG